MASIFDVDLTSSDKETSGILGPPGESVSGIGSFMAGLGSGLFKIPEGVVSLGATLIDLGAGTDTATEVEEFFADITFINIFSDQVTH